MKGYSEKGCAYFLTGYMLALVEDSAAAIRQPDRATAVQHSALARLQNAANGWNRDKFIDLAATLTGTSPREVCQGLLAQAVKAKPPVRGRRNRPVWTFGKAA